MFSHLERKIISYLLLVSVIHHHLVRSGATQNVSLERWRQDVLAAAPSRDPQEASSSQGTYHGSSSSSQDDDSSSHQASDAPHPYSQESLPLRGRNLALIRRSRRNHSFAVRFDSARDQNQIGSSTSSIQTSASSRPIRPPSPPGTTTFVHAHSQQSRVPSVHRAASPNRAAPVWFSCGCNKFLVDCSFTTPRRGRCEWSC